MLEATQFIEQKINLPPEIGLVLGSGLGVLAEEVAEKVTIPYERIPHFPVSTVEGHAGQLVVGTLENKPVVLMQGRFHFYEGYSMKQITFPIRVMKQLGIHSIILTNAAGGIREDFKPGDLMIIRDHIHLMGENPLTGPNEEAFGVRFPDMTETYHRTYIEHAKGCAKQIGLSVKEGVYVANRGPMYETPAEIRMLRTLGGDAVGMSTVPEAIVAQHAGLKILGISCISNMAAGILDKPLSHEEVIETTKKVQKDFLRFVQQIVRTFPKEKAQVMDT